MVKVKTSHRSGVTRPTPSRTPERPRRSWLTSAGHWQSRCPPAVIARPDYFHSRPGAVSRPLNIQGDRCSDAQQKAKVLKQHQMKYLKCSRRRFSARLRPTIIHSAEKLPWRLDMSAFQPSAPAPYIAMPWPHILRAVGINTRRGMASHGFSCMSPTVPLADYRRICSLKPPLLPFYLLPLLSLSSW